MANQSRYLRISITNRCNLKCHFCHKEGQNELLDDTLTGEDIIFVSKVAIEQGFTKIKLTGGEPTLRLDLFQIIQAISQTSIEDFSLVTNGTTLLSCAEKLQEAGLKRMNVTLNTLSKERFRSIYGTHPSILDSITKGIQHAKKIGFDDMKVNFVYTGEDCSQDLDEVLEFVNRHQQSLVLLPLIGKNNRDQIITLDDLYQLLKQKGIVEEKNIHDNEGIVRRNIRLQSGARVILRKDELIDHLPYDFCNACQNHSLCREGIYPIRLTSSGVLLPCLEGQLHHISILDAIKSRNYSTIETALREITSHHKMKEEKNYEKTVG